MLAVNIRHNARQSLTRVLLIALSASLWSSCAQPAVDGSAEYVRGDLGEQVVTASVPPGVPTAFVYFAGDDLTQSRGASDFNSGFRPSLVERWSAERRIDPVVDASSRGVFNLTSSLGNIPPQTSLVILQPSVTNIGDGPAALESFSRGFDQVVRQVRVSAEGATLVCLGFWQTAGWSLDYESAIASHCDGKYLSIRDIYDLEDSRGPAGRSAYLGGGVGDSYYPNDLGYSRIVDRIDRYVDISD